LLFRRELAPAAEEEEPEEPQEEQQQEERRSSSSSSSEGDDDKGDELMQPHVDGGRVQEESKAEVQESNPLLASGLTRAEALAEQKALGVIRKCIEPNCTYVVYEYKLAPCYDSSACKQARCWFLTKQMRPSHPLDKHRASKHGK